MKYLHSRVFRTCAFCASCPLFVFWSAPGRLLSLNSVVAEALPGKLRRATHACSAPCRSGGVTTGDYTIPLLPGRGRTKFRIKLKPRDKQCKGVVSPDVSVLGSLLTVTLHYGPFSEKIGRWIISKELISASTRNTRESDQSARPSFSWSNYSPKRSAFEQDSHQLHWAGFSLMLHQLIQKSSCM